MPWVGGRWSLGCGSCLGGASCGGMLGSGGGGMQSAWAVPVPAIPAIAGVMSRGINL